MNREAGRSSASSEPLYSIGVAARMSGISVPSLRAWELRYGFPRASRTPGGHRLFSERDLLRLRWVKNQIDAGVATAQAIQALHHQERIEEEKTDSWRSPRPPVAAAGSALLIQRGQLVEALSDHALDTASQVLADSLSTFSPEEIILELISPALAELGNRWAEGRIDVATEHLASHFLRERLLSWILNAPPPYAQPPALLACAPGEWHDGSLLMLATLLRRHLVPVAYLGQSVPLGDLAQMVRSLHPTIVVLVAMTESTALPLQEWPSHLLRAASPGSVFVGFGGRVFSLQAEWRSRVPGLFLGETIREGVERIEAAFRATREQAERSPGPQGRLIS
ncbi:MAG: B12-binding domain-containing protein [Anaerolineales bacterium]|jgi:DNA-binding transcriptional MerR regulator